MVATFCIYSQVQNHEFLNYDDNKYVTSNFNVQAGLTRNVAAKWRNDLSEGDGVIYAIAVVASCTGEAKTWDFKCVFLFVAPLAK